MAINFPDSPTTGETFQQADRAWQWDGEKWKSTGTTSSSTVGATVIFEGSTADAFETTLAATDPTADRTITLPNASGTVAFTSDLSSYAPLASPALTGNPVAPTQSSGNNSTRIATTAYADDAASGTPTDITVADTTDTSCSVALFESATGDLAPKSDAGITYNAGTGTLTATGVTVGGTATMDVGIQKAVSIAAENGHCTLALTHAGKLISLGGAASQNITVPPNSSVAFPVGTQIAFFDEQTGGGVNTFVEGSGVTIRSKDSNKIMDGNWTTVVIIKQSTDIWYLFGPLTS